MIEDKLAGYAKSQIDKASSYNEGMRQGYIQAKSEWIGLTDEDCDEVERWVEFKEEGSGRIPTSKLIQYIEFKLKERNT